MPPTPAQRYAAVVGGALVLAGILGLFVSAAFGAPGHTADLLGLLTVNGYHDLVHLLSGLAGLAVAGRARPSRGYAGALGVVYAAVAIYGFALGASGNLLGIVPVNIADDLLHIALAVLGIGAWLASYEKPSVTARLT